MTAKNLTRWTCDRCGSVKETQPGRVPALWAVATAHNLSQPEGKPIHLCNPCEVIAHMEQTRTMTPVTKDDAWTLVSEIQDLRSEIARLHHVSCGCLGSPSHEAARPEETR